MIARSRALSFVPSAFVPALACLFLGCGFAAEGSGGSLALATSVQASPSLERALAAIDVERLRADLEYLASDELAGRDTPSEGLDAAARYLAKQLAEAGLEPGAFDARGEATWFYEYPLHYQRLDPERSELLAEGAGGQATLRFGRDYFLANTRELVDLDVEGGVTAIGSGSRSELAEVRLAGRWALVFERNKLSRRTISSVQADGALGLVVVPSLDYTGRPYPSRYERTSETLLAGSAGQPRQPQLAGPALPPFPVVYVDSVAGTELARVAGLDALPATGELQLNLRERRARTHPGGRLALRNVCALVPGRSEALRGDVIVLSAHYDHVGAKGELIWNGADDNASGTSGLLELARALQTVGGLERSVLLMWVSGEEKGLWGSEAWARAPRLPDGCRPVANINIDMIGRNAPDDLTATPSPRMGDEYNGLGRLAKELAPVEGFAQLRSADEYWQRSDHVNFARFLGLPVCFLFADIHEDYHQPSDTADKIDYDKIRRVVRLVLRMLDRLQGPVLDLKDGGAPDLESYRERARAARAQRDMAELGRALEAWAIAHRAGWPQELGVLVDAPEGEPPFWSGALPTDPWGRPYRYAREGQAARLWTFGADGEQGGEGEAADLVLGGAR